MVLFNRRKYMGVRRSPQGAPLDIADAVITVASSVLYTGTPRTPVVEVVYDGETLVANVDYFVAYNDNTNLGAATAVVTGTGSFTGSVIKTFYIVADGGGGSAWDFDLANAALIDTASIPSTNLQYSMPIVEDYDELGNAMLPVHHWLSGNWVKGYSLPRDSNGEIHVANLDTSEPVVVDSSGAGGDYLHPFHFDRNGSFWYSNNGSYVLKAKDGTSSPSFEGYVDRVIQSPQFVHGGRRIFLYYPNGYVYSFDLGSRYDVSTIDLESKIMSVIGVGQNIVRTCAFNNTGTQALVSRASSNYVWHYSCPTPYSLENATEMSRVAFTGYPVSLNVVNGGKTLIAGAGSAVYEYNLVA